MHNATAGSPLPKGIFLQLLGFTAACFAGSYIVGLLLVKPLFGLDALGNPYALSNYESDPKVLLALLFIQGVWALGTFMVPVFLVARLLNETFGSFARLQKPGNVLYFWSGVVVLAVINPLLTFTVEVNEQLQLPDAFSALENWMKQAEDSAAQLTKAILYSDGQAMLIIKLLVIAVIPALCEELLFRAGLQQLLLRKTGKIHLSVWVSAAIFSAIHFQFYGFLPRMLLGAVLGYLMVCSGSLWPGVVFHLLNNATGVVIGHFHLDTSGIALLSESYVYPWYAVVLSTVLSVAVVVYWITHFKQHGTRLD